MYSLSNVVLQGAARSKLAHGTYFSYLPLPERVSPRWSRAVHENDGVLAETWRPLFLSKSVFGITLMYYCADYILDGDTRRQMGTDIDLYFRSYPLVQSFDLPLAHQPHVFVRCLTCRDIGYLPRTCRAQGLALPPYLLFLPVDLDPSALVSYG